MYRIHFTANGALRTERAVLEISPAGVRWRFKPGEEPDDAALSQASLITARTADGAVGRRQSTPSSRGNSLVMGDYAHRWPAYQRRRLLRRWKAEVTEAATLIANDLSERIDAAVLQLIAAFGSKAPEGASNSDAVEVAADPAPSPAQPVPAVVEEGA